MKNICHLRCLAWRECMTVLSLLGILRGRGSRVISWSVAFLWVDVSRLLLNGVSGLDSPTENTLYVTHLRVLPGRSQKRMLAARRSNSECFQAPTHSCLKCSL